MPIFVNWVFLTILQLLMVVRFKQSAYRAIKNGIKINDVFSIASQFKKINKNKPIILMGYYNMIYQYDENKIRK